MPIDQHDTTPVTCLSVDSEMEASQAIKVCYSQGACYKPIIPNSKIHKGWLPSFEATQNPIPRVLFKTRWTSRSKNTNRSDFKEKSSSNKFRGCSHVFLDTFRILNEHALKHTHTQNAQNGPLYSALCTRNTTALVLSSSHCFQSTCHWEDLPPLLPDLPDPGAPQGAETRDIHWVHPHPTQKWTVKTNEPLNQSIYYLWKKVDVSGGRDTLLPPKTPKKKPAWFLLVLSKRPAWISLILLAMAADFFLFCSSLASLTSWAQLQWPGDSSNNNSKP